MNDLEPIRQRLMREEPRKRLGHLAADLLRIANFIESGSANEAKPILRESKWFAEWIAPDAPLETQVMLAETQLALAIWERGWLNGSPVATMRDDAQQKSDELLKLAGLI